jgi:hypothetical protein
MMQVVIALVFQDAEELLARADGTALVGRGGAQRDQSDDGWATAAVEYG